MANHNPREFTIVKSNTIIEAKYKLSVREQKFILYMASLIKPEDKDFQFYEIRVSDLDKILNTSGKKWGSLYKEVHQMIDNLMTKRLEFMDEEKNELIKTTWVASTKTKITDGIISFEFSHRLKKYLLQLKEQFTKYKFKYVIRLNSSHSIRIYELLKRYQFRKEVTFELPELKSILGLDNKYKEYKDFKKRILLDTQKELEEKSDIRFDFETERIGRKIHYITFYIFTNLPKDTPHEVQALGPLFDALPHDDNQENNPIVVELIKMGVSEKQALEISIEGFQIVMGRRERNQAMQLFGSFENYIARHIEYVNERRKQQKVASPAGLLIEALKKNYMRSTIEEELGEEKRKKKAEELQQRREKIELKKEALQKQYYTQESKICKNILTNNPDLLEELVEKVRYSPIVSNVYEEQKSAEQNYKKPAVHAMVKAELVKLFPEEFEQNLKNFQKEQQKLDKPRK